MFSINDAEFIFLLGECTKSEDDVILFYSRHCTGAVEWAKYLHKLYTELSKHKGRLRYVYFLKKIVYLPAEITYLNFAIPYLESPQLNLL